MKKLVLGFLLALASCVAPAFAYNPPQSATAPITLSTSNVIACATCLTTSSNVVNTLSFGTTGLTPNSATTGAITVAGILVGANGGTGVANTGKTITIGANLTTTGAGAPTLAFPASSFTYTYPLASSTLLATNGSGSSLTFGTGSLSLAGGLTTSGAFNSTFTMTGTTAVTFPTAGTLATTTGALTPSSVASTGAVSGTTGTFSAGINSTAIGATTPSTGAFTTLSATGITSLGSAAQASVDASGNIQTTGNISDISTTANAVLVAQGHQQSGGGSFLKLRDDTLGNYGYLGDNSVIFGGTSYNELVLTNPQASGTICIVSNGGGSSTANTGCDILDDASNNINIGKALKPPAARKGTFVCTAGGTITITNTNYIATSDVTITMNTAGGTITTPPAMKTVTPATGFTVLCGATDTSTYNYTIWN